MRLNRFLSRAGITSRREADELLNGGRVLVNGELVLKPGKVIDTDEDIVEFDGRVIRLPSEYTYIAFNKPSGIVTTMGDGQGRPTIESYIVAMEKVLKLSGGLFPVGRLDTDTTGLIIITNDGQYAERVIHPRYEVEREYILTLDKKIEDAEMNKIERGVMLSDGRTLPAKVAYKGSGFTYSIVVREGRKRLIRRMFDKFGYSVVSLKRVRIGALKLGSLVEGEWRLLSREEAGLAQFKF